VDVVVDGDDADAGDDAEPDGAAAGTGPAPKKKTRRGSLAGATQEEAPLPGPGTRICRRHGVRGGDVLNEAGAIPGRTGTGS
jgi:hypothetical protein